MIKLSLIVYYPLNLLLFSYNPQNSTTEGTKIMTELKKFRLINKIEGISFLILLFVAMPLKYYAGIPLATKIVGMAHGIFVFAFLYQLFAASDEAPFSGKEMGILTLMSLIPFGSFYNDKLCAKKEP